MHRPLSSSCCKNVLSRERALSILTPARMAIRLGTTHVPLTDKEKSRMLRLLTEVQDMNLKAKEDPAKHVNQHYQGLMSKLMDKSRSPYTVTRTDDGTAQYVSSAKQLSLFNQRLDALNTHTEALDLLSEYIYNARLTKDMAFSLAERNNLVTPEDVLEKIQLHYRALKWSVYDRMHVALELSLKGLCCDDSTKFKNCWHTVERFKKSWLPALEKGKMASSLIPDLWKLMTQAGQHDSLKLVLDRWQRFDEAEPLSHNKKVLQAVRDLYEIAFFNREYARCCKRIASWANVSHGFDANDKLFYQVLELMRSRPNKISAIQSSNIFKSRNNDIELIKSTTYMAKQMIESWDNLCASNIVKATLNFVYLRDMTGRSISEAFALGELHKVSRGLGIEAPKTSEDNTPSLARVLSSLYPQRV